MIDMFIQNHKCVHVCLTTGNGVWYGAHIVAVKRGRFDLQYADGDTELLVPSSRIRRQRFSSGDIVEVVTHSPTQYSHVTHTPTQYSHVT